MNKKIIKLAIPSIISNITVPLLGLVDVAIVGHIGAASYIGAIAVGGMLFNILYWLFGFLRMGTSGMTSQALGRRDLQEVKRILCRSIGIALTASVLILILQYPIRWLAFILIETTAEVEQLATLYFHICIWGAPAVLGLYAFSGWFIGMQNSRFPMFIAITQNIVNIIASLIFVYVFEMKVEGVALGTLVAQYAGLFIAVILWWKYYGKIRGQMILRELMDPIAMNRFFKINRDIFFRTLCVISVTTFFTSTGAKQGDIVLAVNTLMMQLFTLYSYIMDGFAYAGEALSGRYIGADNKISFSKMIHLLFGWGIGVACFFTLLYGCWGKEFLGLLTDDSSVIKESEQYFYWILAIPVAGFSAFLWDGIFIGATATRFMLYSMFVATAFFFLIYWGFVEVWGNHALWLAFITYLSMRGIMQWILWRIKKSEFFF